MRFGGHYAVVIPSRILVLFLRKLFFLVALCAVITALQEQNTFSLRLCL